MQCLLVTAILMMIAASYDSGQVSEQKPPPSLKKDRSLASQQDVQNALPRGWSAAGTRPQDYEIGVDAAQQHSGRASAYLQLKRFKYNSEGFAALIQIFKADDYKGQRVRLSAYVRTQEVGEYAGLWMRVDGEGRMLGFDNMHNRPINGTTVWTKYEVVLDVPETSLNIAIGLLLRGPGRAWVDDFQLEAVDEGVATTNRLSPAGIAEKGGRSKVYPRAPVNLNFED